MPEPGKGLELQLRIKRLMRQHGIEQTVWDLCHVPMVASVEQPQILTGYASTTHLDRSRMRFRAYAFRFPLARKSAPVPLYYKHREDERVGRIDALEYDAAGQLLIRCTVTHELARRCAAFSVGATVREYQIVNAERPDFHALISVAELTEVSLTDTPANPRALVTQRSKPCAQAEFYGNMLSLVSGLQRAVALIQTGVRT